MPLFLWTGAVGVLAGATLSWLAMDTLADLDAAKRRETALVAELKQEKKNAEVQAEHVRDVTAVQLYYQSHPVRVRLPARAESTGCTDVSAKDIVLTVGGLKRGDGAATP